MKKLLIAPLFVAIAAAAFTPFFQNSYSRFFEPQSKIVARMSYANFDYPTLNESYIYSELPMVTGLIEISLKNIGTKSAKNISIFIPDLVYAKIDYIGHQKTQTGAKVEIHNVGINEEIHIFGWTNHYPNSESVLFRESSIEVDAQQINFDIEKKYFGSILKEILRENSLIETVLFMLVAVMALLIFGNEYSKRTFKSN